MARYIDANKLKEVPIFNKKYSKGINEHFAFGLETVMEYIEDMPAADVQEVKHGKWLIVRDDFENTLNECSYCEIQYFCENGNLGFSYCPNCGAKMDGGEK